jgi:TRAP-type uncharacterized transport system fused permease subunit
MLVATAFLSILLGMGMPTAAVYVVLSIVLAPALVELQVAPMAAHLFIFYFGLLSMLTPPVAIASYVAASLAEADMWRTSLVAVRLVAVAYALPFLWVFNPALLLTGPASHVLLATATALLGGWIFTGAVRAPGVLEKGAYVLTALVAGSATLWAGAGSLWSIAPGGLALLFIQGRRALRSR